MKRITVLILAGIAVLLSLPTFAKSAPSATNTRFSKLNTLLKNAYVDGNVGAGKVKEDRSFDKSVAQPNPLSVDIEVLTSGSIVEPRDNGVAWVRENRERTPLCARVCTDAESSLGPT